MLLLLLLQLYGLGDVMQRMQRLVMAQVLMMGVMVLVDLLQLMRLCWRMEGCGGAQIKNGMGRMQILLGWHPQT